MDPSSKITKRQRQCLLLSACGLRENEIAKELEISPHTVRVHMTQAKIKLGASNKSHTIVLALITNNLSLDEIQRSPHFKDAKL